MVFTLRWLKSLNAKRAVAFCVAYVAFCGTVISMLLPSTQAPEQTVEGAISTYKTCGRSCDEGIQVGTVVLACSASLLGHAYHCAQHFNQALPAKAQYIVQQTFLSSAGVSNPSRLLLRLEQQGRVVFAQGPSHYRARALYGSWSFYTLLAFILLGALNMPYLRRSSVEQANGA